MDNKRKLSSKQNEFIEFRSELKLAKKLWGEAARIRKRAHAPYSNFLVGAAASTSRGILAACNVENLSLGGTICAERSLVCRLIAENARPMKMLCVVTKLKDNPKDGASPCGICLQVLSEFCAPELPIWIGNPKGLVRRTTLGELLPGMLRFKRGAF